jgi:predicted dinucleotide-binding enzyme
MSISIIGAGNVGQALAKAFTLKGESIFFGVPDADKYRSAVTSISNKIRIGSVQDAVAASDVIILAIPYAATKEVATSIKDWGGKVLVDATNPIAGGLSGLSVGTVTSGAEEIAKVANGARVVKAFNVSGAENMADSHYPNGAVFMPICGDDSSALAQVKSLATLIGFDAVDMGDLKSARYLEPFAMTWIHLAIKMGYGRRFAFGLLKR